MTEVARPSEECNGKCRGYNSNAGFVADPACPVHGVVRASNPNLDALIKRVNVLIPDSVKPSTRISIHPCDWIELVNEIDDLQKRVAPETSELPSHQAIANQLSSMRPGSTKCPLCARTYVHEHTPEELIIYRNGVKHGLSLADQPDGEPRCPDCGLLLDPPGHDLNCPRRALKAAAPLEPLGSQYDGAKAMGPGDK
jgi:hypothetical protein